MQMYCRIPVHFTIINSYSQKGGLKMPLEFLDKEKMCDLLTRMWQKHLDTDKNPAEKNKEDHLVGNLTDTLASNLILDEDKKAFMPDTFIPASFRHSNIDGISSLATVELSHTHTKSTTTTHSVTNSAKWGIGQEIKASCKIFGVGAESTTKFSFEYTHSWTNGTNTTESDSDTFKVTVPLNVPAGEVYEARLYAELQKLTIPYRALIHVQGFTSTWFIPNNLPNYLNMWIGIAFSKIAELGLAGEESHYYGANPENPKEGIITQYGIITVSQTANFYSRVFPVTKEVNDGLMLSRKLPEIIRTQEFKLDQ